MSRLDELQRVFGGHIRSNADREWLDTQISGLRAFIIRRAATFELAMFTPQPRELDPFLARMDAEWILDTDHGIPHLPRGFLFTGCRGGVLFATYLGEPSLEDLVATAWELSRWARLAWRSRTPADYAVPLPLTRRWWWWILAVVLAIIVVRACYTRGRAAADTSAASAPGTSGMSSRARS